MGSTGHSIYGHSRTGEVNTETFGIAGAVNFKGKVPANSGLDPVGGNKVTLKLPGPGDDNIIFQFKLTKDKSDMLITGYKNGVPEVKAKVAVDAGYPSLDTVIAKGKKAEKTQALKVKQLMAMTSAMSEDQLGPIANKLKKNANIKRGENT